MKQHTPIRNHRRRGWLVGFILLSLVVVLVLPVYAGNAGWENEPNNGFAQANPLGHGELMHGRLDAYDGGEQAIDFYNLFPVWQRKALLEITVDGSEDGLRPKLCVYNKRRRLTTCSDNESEVVDALDVILPQRGNVYVSVEAAGDCPGGGGCVGRYELQVNVVLREWEFNDSFGSAMRLYVSRSGFDILGALDRHGQIPYAEDEDFFRIKNTVHRPADAMTFRVESRRPGVVDPDICLYRRPRKLIACSQTPGADELTYDFAERDIIWVQVMADCHANPDTCRGEYILRISEP